MASQDDDDLRLIRASNSLLEDLERSLPRLLWKSKTNRVHQLVRLRDLDYVLQLIEPFQPEPQLLDTRLKVLLPTIINSYLSYLQLPSPKFPPPATVSLDVAVSKILYVFCKVRGEKVITGFLNNEPRYLNLILCALEACSDSEKDADAPWEKSYVLLLWLRHLLLAPFDLASISGPGDPPEILQDLRLPPDVPSLTSRVLAVNMRFITNATKEQDAASKLLVRLVTRPDMQRLNLPASLVSWALRRLSSTKCQTSSSVHTFLGPLRFLVGMTMSPDTQEMSSLVPSIYLAVQNLMGDAMFAFLSSSAVTKKLVIKLFRNVALLSLQPASGVLGQFLETIGVLEDTIDYLLQSLGDRDTPVRFAASKALSMIILRLEPALSHEVVQAVLDIMKDDVPRSSVGSDFSTVDPLRWHGLTLTLAHALFRRSASPAQLAEIVNALLLALTFEQRSTTGSSIGSNVRDAACFGIWSLSRRYTTSELLTVDVSELRSEDGVPHADISVIQLLAIHLLLSACLDPAGNIRRGSSAALQELVGRHPDQVSNGIPLVQVVDYNAVGLRQRALIEVSLGASSLNTVYRRALLMALLKWRGINSPDVASRDMAASSIGRLCKDQPISILGPVLESLYKQTWTSSIDVERFHGSLLALSRILDEKLSWENLSGTPDEAILSYLARAWQVFERQQSIYTDYNPRSLRADLFSAVAQIIKSLADLSTNTKAAHMPSFEARANVSVIVSGLVARSEDSILTVLPKMVQALVMLHLAAPEEPSILNVKNYLSRLRPDVAAIVLHGAGRAIALAAAYPHLDRISACNPLEVVDTLGEIIRSAHTTEWRVVGLQALLIIIEFGSPNSQSIERLLQPLHAGLNDYTITERGDVGSLVRTAAVGCVGSLWKLDLAPDEALSNLLLVEDVTRLSLEKLDRTRLQAARCLRMRDKTPSNHSREILTDVSSTSYFWTTLDPLKDPACPEWQLKAMLKGLASSAGVGAEALLQSARAALTDTVYTSEESVHLALMTSLTMLLKSTVVIGADPQPMLELLAFLLDSVPQLCHIEGFNWRNLLALIQKSHFKSNSIPRILAAVDVYRGLAGYPSVRPEVLKKLVSMLRTNPYPRIRIAVAECLYLATGHDRLRDVDWGKPGQKYDGPS
ncbi:armadillo-type protein [Delphinella strobiligena]|nr:armadillo-type protein [Delphinella strobiligena]